MVSLAAARFVETIEAFKQTRLLLLRDFLPAVLYRKHSMSPLPVKGKTDLIASVGMADGIVQKDRYELGQLRAVSLKHDTVVDFAPDGEAVLESHAFKGQGFAGDETGKIQLFHLYVRVFRTRQIEELCDQIPHAFIFIADVIQPFIGAQLPEQELRIGGNHGNRRFQLVPRIGDKLLLPLIVFLQRLYDPSG